MEQYKDKLKKRLFLLSGCLVLYIVANFIMYACVGAKGNASVTDFVFGFQFGIGFFVFAGLLYYQIYFSFA